MVPEWMAHMWESLHLSRQQVEILAKLSSLSGYLSMSFWLFAQIPQVIKNFTDKSIEGFSLAFLLCWFGGDFLNLVSCLLNDAMMFQILLSSYYCLIDIILAFQYYYYTKMYCNPESRWYHPPHKKHIKIHSPRTSLRDNLQSFDSIDLQMESDNHNSQNRIPTTVQSEILSTPNYKTSPRIHVQGIFNKGRKSTRSNTNNRKTSKGGVKRLVSAALISGISKAHSLPIVKGIESTIKESQDLENNSIIYRIAQFFLTMTSLKFGKILAWSCTCLYLVSRIPQLYTNYQLQSTKGISLKLICFALCGNLFYSLSLLLCESSTVGGDSSAKFWSSELSYFIGAIGTVLFDSLVLVQWYRYDHHSKHRTTKSGKLKLISPKIEIKDVVEYTSESHELNTPLNQSKSNYRNIVFHERRNSSYTSTNMRRTDPIEMSASVKSTLSPNHIRKISEFTPLSPMDFLLDDYMSTNNNNSHQSNIVKSLRKSNNVATPSIHTVINNDEELNMSMDEHDE